MKAAGKFLFYHFPAIVYAAAIIALSSIPNPRPLPIRVLLADKLAHLVEYGIFAFLIFRSFTNIGTRMPARRALFLSALFICLFAAFDEYYQRFISGRHPDAYDLAADVLGALLVLLLMWLKHRKRQPAESLSEHPR